MTHISAPFIRRPKATTLLCVAVMLAGVFAYLNLPVASLPQTEFPTISVQASLPGADPAVMAASVATPLERQFGRIAGVTEMTSSSSLGATTVNLQFDLNRDLNGAAREVQAAINAARSQLPSDLPNQPSYRKVNPTEPSILILVIESETVPLRELYDLADSVLAQSIAQVQGVGQVSLNGSSKPAVRVQVNPHSLNAYGLSFETLRSVLSSASILRPKGRLDDGSRQWDIAANDQLMRAEDYAPLIIHQHGGAAVRLRDVATVTDSVEDVRTGGLINGRNGLQIIVNKAPEANTIATVDAILALLPQLSASLPPTVRLYPMMDRTKTIRASIKDISWMLILSVALVMLVVFAFLREFRSTIIPSVSVPVSLLGTFAIMYVLGYTLDNLSLMAVTIATGFVVDDAIVVIENVDRFLRNGDQPVQAALRSSEKVGFTVIAMSISLVSAFIPMLLMGGIVGRLFREFAITLSIAIGLSLLVSLFVTPMLCSVLLQPHGRRRRGRLYFIGESILERIEEIYSRGLRWALRHQSAVLVIAVTTCGLAIYLYVAIPKGFFPQQDTGRVTGQIRASQDISFNGLSEKAKMVLEVASRDPDVDSATSFFGANSIGPSPNAGSFFFVVKDDVNHKNASSNAMIHRLRPQLSELPGVSVTMQEQQELNLGARSSAAQFQYTLSSNSLDQLNEWAPRMTEKMRTMRVLRDVMSDQLTDGLAAQLVLDRDTASRFGIAAKDLDAVLDDSFGQRQISTIYSSVNQYHLVLESLPRFQLGPDALAEVYVPSSKGKPVPLAVFSKLLLRKAPLVVNHQAQIPSVTISFNLAPGHSLSDAVEMIEAGALELGMPEMVHAGFAGSAQAFQASFRNQPLLILLALATIYLVLGMLYESLIYPLAILSTLPSAGVGALFALMLAKEEFSVMAMIGIVLLIGIVQKNSIMLVDAALWAERHEGLTPTQAIYQACLHRFRPICMTTTTAILGAMPLALGHGVGFELRRPLGISIVGGLAASLLLTLYSTPVIYVYVSRLGTATQALPSLRNNTPQLSCRLSDEDGLGLLKEKRTSHEQVR